MCCPGTPAFAVSAVTRPRPGGMRGTSAQREPTLAAAIERARAQGAVAGNAYGWYRKQAARDGQVHIGSQRVATRKRGRQWVGVRVGGVPLV